MNNKIISVISAIILLLSGGIAGLFIENQNLKSDINHFKGIIDKKESYIQNLTDIIARKDSNIKNLTVAEIQTGSQIGNNELYNLILDKTNSLVNLLDSRYLKPKNISTIRKFLNSSRVDNKSYISDYYDCDDYAIALMAEAKSSGNGIAFGYVQVTQRGSNFAHALNFFVYNSKIYLVEPQTDSIMKLNEVNYIIQFMMI